MEPIFIVEEKIVRERSILFLRVFVWRMFTRFSLVYTAHLSGTMTSIFGDGMNTVMSFTIATHDIFYCSFGGVDGLSELRASAAQVRCVRDE